MPVPERRPTVYLAGASAPAELERVERWADKLRAAGAEVVSTWTANVRSVGSGNPREASREQRKRLALNCLTELATARVFWFLVPPIDTPTRGAWCELDRALTLDVPAVLSGDTKQSVFGALAFEEETDEAAFELVLILLNLAVP